ncbi:histidine phosphatase family protein [Streptomyces naphthomycinicus]|uniref:histidine phosphatase family protein n=1 Tax=Streptomyces naphthomycinicus TaxID=2872625 RepID=UPI001CED7F80|nr:histidine phosphatase family protein [Streptomyces sp. TML10]
MVTVRLTMLCASTARDSRDRVFGDDALSERGRGELTTAKAALSSYAPVIRAPSILCAQTADALAVEATPENAVRDLDYGLWDGRPLTDIAAEDPYGFSAWLTDPDAAPHGGESVGRLCRRTATWLHTLAAETRPVLAITEASVIRAALVHALSAPVRAFWHLDVAPLAMVTLTLHDGRWHVRLGHLAVPPQWQPADDSVPVAVLTRPVTRQHMCLTGQR